MQTNPFSTFPDDSRLWIFPISGDTSEPMLQSIAEELKNWIQGWTAHKEAVVGGIALVAGKFLMVAADSRSATTSGCSIDSMFQKVSETFARNGVKTCDPSSIFIKNEVNTISAVETMSREEFRQACMNKTINESTIVFDPLVDRVGALREGRFEVAIKNSWHLQLLNKYIESASSPH